MANQHRGYDGGYGNGGGHQYMDDTPPRGANPRSPQGRDSYGGHPNGGPGGYGGPGGLGGHGGHGGGGYSSAMSQHGGPQHQGEDLSDCNIDEIMTKLRDVCTRRGVSGFKHFRRMFKIYDRGVDDKKLSYDELFYGLQNYGAEFSQKECKAVIRKYSRDGDDTLSFDEFMRAVRPPLAKSREELIRKAFRVMDKTGDGVITAADLKNNFKVDQHPKFKSGEWTAKKCYDEFLTSFEPDDGNKDGTVTWDEFLDYYCGVSSSIDRDVYFDYMMRQSWKF